MSHPEFDYARDYSIPYHCPRLGASAPASISRLMDMVRSYYGRALRGTTLAVWSLPSGAGAADRRLAAARGFILALLAEGATLRVYDPTALPAPSPLHGARLLFGDRPYGTLEDSDGLVIVTAEEEYHSPDFEMMRRLLREPVIFDAHHLYPAMVLARHGFDYRA